MSVAEAIVGELVSIPIDELDADYNFNCRGKIAPIDVVDLVKSIQENGLQSPIVIHKYNEEEALNTNKSFRLISGFRRFTALKILNYEEIPCLVKPWMSEGKARILNLEENLKRQDLNVVQEAKALAKLKYAGYTQEMVAKELNVGRSWVQVRYNVLDFPEDIQDELATGLLNQQQIKELYSLPRNQQYEAIRNIKDRKIKGEKNVMIKRPVSAVSKRIRKGSEMNQMKEHLFDNLGPSFATRVLAWCTGDISSLELFNDIKKKMELKGKIYFIPKDEFN